MAACLPGWLPGCLSGRLPTWLAACLAACLPAWLPRWLPGCLAACPACPWLPASLPGLLSGCRLPWLSGCLPGVPAHLASCLPAWLAACLAARLPPARLLASWLPASRVTVAGGRWPWLGLWLAACASYGGRAQLKQHPRPEDRTTELPVQVKRTSVLASRNLEGTLAHRSGAPAYAK